MPTKVTASASTGTATDLGIADGCEDTISLLVDWQSADNPKKRGTAVYTSSWTAPIGCELVLRFIGASAEELTCAELPATAGVHSEQHFHYMGSKGEVRVNQSRRGYNVTVSPLALPFDAETAR